MRILTKIYTVLLLSSLFITHSYSQSVYFNDSGQDTMFAGNSYYELALSKTDGHFDYIKDKSTGKIVSIGNENQTFWRIVFLNGGDLYSINYVGGQQDRFAYHWYADGDSLVFNYMTDKNSTQNMSANAKIVLSGGHHFDLSMNLTNNASDSVKSINFPHALMFEDNEIQSAYLPFLPGVKLDQNFFTEHRSWQNGYYPSGMIFADYLQLETTSGDFCLYNILREDFTPYIARRFFYVYDGDIKKNIYVLAHSYRPVLPPGKTWNSPIVRIRIGQDVYTTAEDFRNDTGLDTVMSIRQKLGKNYSRFVRALSSHTGIDALYGDWNLRLSDEARYKEAFAKLPSSLLIIFTGWQERGFDESNPDVFPPDTRFGTNKDLTNICNIVKSDGDVLSAYLNPTYWDDQSQTIKSLGVQNVAILHHDGIPDIETYGSGAYTHTGYGVSPFNSSVISRLQTQMDNFKKIINPTSAWIDQIGSRTGLDFNPTEPRADGLAQGWLDYARKYRSENIIDEWGNDRMVGPLLGFQGNLLELLSSKSKEYGDPAWGAGNWEYFPLVPLMARDKVLMYNAGDNICNSKDTLTWCMAMGQLISFPMAIEFPDNDWLWTDASIQKNALSLYADEKVTGYTHQSDSVTVTDFQNYSVLANWSRVNPLQSGGDIIAARGFLLTGDNGNVKAGIFHKFSGEDLSAGDNYIIYHQYADSIVINYPMGPGTNFQIQIPSGWGSKPDVRIYAATRSTVYARPVTINSGTANIFLSDTLNGERIDRYVVSNGPLYLTSPIPSYPLNGINVTESTPSVTWHKVEGAQNYELQIALDNSFTNLVYDYNVPDTSKMVDSLSSGTTFFWHVRGYKNGKPGPWSVVSDFRTFGINLSDGLIAFYDFNGSAEDISSFRNNGTVESGVTAAKDIDGNPNHAFDFNGSGGYINIPESVSYLSADKQITVAAWVYPRSYKSEEGIVVHENFWRLMLSDGNVTGNIFNDQHQESRVLSNSQVPLNQWSHIAFTYDGKTIRVYQNAKLMNQLDFPANRIGGPDQSSPITIGHGIGLSQNYFNGIMDNVAVYNRALSDTEISALMNTNDLLLPPPLDSPPDNSTGIRDTVNLSWAMQPGVKAYGVQVSLDNHFMSSIIIDTVVADTSLSAVNLQADTTFYWRVRSIGDSSQSGWSLYQSFNTNIISAVKSSNKIPVSYELFQNYPNPFNPSTTIRFQIPGESKVMLKIYDILGREVADIVNKRLSPGTYNIDWNAGGLPSGVYIYRLQAGSFVSSKKLLLLK